MWNSLFGVGKDTPCVKFLLSIIVDCCIAIFPAASSWTVPLLPNNTRCQMYLAEETNVLSKTSPTARMTFTIVLETSQKWARCGFMWAVYQKRFDLQNEV